MSRPQNPIVRLLEFAGPHKRLTIAGCALSALNAVLAIAMLVCVWFVVRDLVAVAPAWGEARQAPVYGAWALAFALAGLVGTWAGSTLVRSSRRAHSWLSFCALLGAVAVFMVRSQLRSSESSSHEAGARPARSPLVDARDRVPRRPRSRR